MVLQQSKAGLGIRQAKQKPMAYEVKKLKNEVKMGKRGPKNTK